MKIIGNFIRGKAGFTMIEIMVVALLLSVVALGIGSTFVSGVKVWERIRNRNLTEIFILLTMEQMAKELRQSVRTNLETFHGSDSALVFPFLKGDKIERVSYTFNSAAKAVVRNAKDLNVSDEGHSETQEKEDNVLVAVEGAFEYLSSPSEEEPPFWSGKFEDGQGVLHAVRCKMSTGNKIFEKTVFLPQGV